MIILTHYFKESHTYLKTSQKLSGFRFQSFNLIQFSSNIVSSLKIIGLVSLFFS